MRQSLRERLRVEHFNCLPNTPVLPLAVFGWAELLHEGLCTLATTAVCWDHKAIVAFVDDEPVGVLTWTDANWANEIWINLAYVSPEYRHQGIHTEMFDALKAKARELKRPTISSATHVSNDAARGAMRAQGREEVGTMLTYHVPAPAGD
jgi:GNAT superfamily N-acetyltransferase